MTIQDLKQQQLIILECISGSRAYGLDTPTSDTDIKGVFILPKEVYYGLHYTPQVTNETNDEVFYELGRFLELLSVNNPNILELLNTPKESVLYKHPLLEQVTAELFLSKLCKDTFGRFALSQIKKAKGLNKKIVNPIDKKRKTILSFCFVNQGQGAVPLLQYLSSKNWRQEYCGLVDIPHMRDLYGLYYNEQLPYKGIIRHEQSNEVCLSPVAKEARQEALLYINKDGYSSYCREYKEYWDWVEKRNEVRYENTLFHGKNYDAKNMMHVFRLLDMAIEIGKEKKIQVKRPNRSFLLEIKAGHYEYEELLQMAEAKQAEMEEAFLHSDLPEKPDSKVINLLAYQLRETLYSNTKKEQFLF